jgi:hypothetical protein
MQAPLLVRPPSEEERQALAAGLRSADAFTLRRHRRHRHALGLV